MGLHSLRSGGMWRLVKLLFAEVVSTPVASCSLAVSLVFLPTFQTRLVPVCRTYVDDNFPLLCNL